MAKKLLHRSEITRELVDKWIAECGTPSDAARRHYNEIESGRYPGSACTYNAARHFIADVLSGGPPSNKILINASEEANLNRLRELLIAANVPVDQIGKIKVAGFTSLGVKLKQEDGSERLTSKYNTRLVLEPSWTDGPKWPVVQPAPRSEIKYIVRAPSPTPTAKRYFLWPDTQIGFYRSVQTGKLSPMHDLRAIDVALQMLKAFRADEVIILGDFLDLTELSKWPQYAEFSHTTQPAINFGYLLLSHIRSIVGPTAPIKFLAGNHERRMAEYIALNAVKAHGLMAADKNLDNLDLTTFVPKTWKWPMHSVPVALHLDELGVEYSAEYPAGEFWANKRNVFTHAPDKATKREIRANVFHGHIPEAKMRTQTVWHHPEDGSSEFSVVAIPGLMGCGLVLDKAALVQNQTASNRVKMNWQQGVGTLIVFNDKEEKHEICRIKDGRGIMGETLFIAERDTKKIVESMLPAPAKKR